MNECLVFIEDLGHHRNDPVHFLPAIDKLMQKDGDIVIRAGICITPGPRPVQHDPLDTLSVQPTERLSEALQNRIGDCADRHRSISGAGVRG